MGSVIITCARFCLFVCLFVCVCVYACATYNYAQWFRFSFIYSLVAVFIFSLTERSCLSFKLVNKNALSHQKHSCCRVSLFCDRIYVRDLHTSVSRVWLAYLSVTLLSCVFSVFKHAVKEACAFDSFITYSVVVTSRLTHFRQNTALHL